MLHQQRPKTSPFVILALAGALGLSFFIVPVARGCGAPRASIPALSDANRKLFGDFLTSHYQAPADYILQSFDSHDIVFVGDLFFADNFEMIRKLLPGLHQKGVRTIGLEYALNSDQAEVDALLAAPEFDEAKAKAVLLNSFIHYANFLEFPAFPDTLALFREVWAFNRGLKRGAKIMRLLCLGQRVDMTYFTREEHKDKKDLQRQALNNITLEEAVFNTIDAALIRKKEKALLYVNIHNCYKNVVDKQYAAFYEKLDIAFRGTPAALVREKLKERVEVIVFHNVWRTHDDNGSLLFPVDGVLDALLRGLPEGKRATAFRVAESPFRDLPFARGLTDKAGNPFPFKDVCDAYLLNGELHRQRLTPLPADAFDRAAMLRFFDVVGVDAQRANVSSPAEFVTKLNEQVAAANKKLSELPR